jgi:hypothetical protein
VPQPTTLPYAPAIIIIKIITCPSLLEAVGARVPVKHFGDWYLLYFT